MVAVSAAMWKEQFELKSLSTVLYFGPTAMVILGFLAMWAASDFVTAFFLLILAGSLGFFQDMIRSKASDLMKA